MKLQKHEHYISEESCGRCITISRKALEDWLAFYHEEVEKFRKKEQFGMMLMYDSRAGLLEDILEHFEED